MGIRRILGTWFKRDIPKLFILAEPRSGSSWLMNTLNSHPEIDLSGELYNHVIYPGVLGFHKVQPEQFPRCIDYLEKELAAAAPGLLKQKNSRYCGCKILLNQLVLISIDFPAYFIEAYKDSYFVFLYRENSVDAHISLEIAHAYKTWHVHENKNIIKRTVRVNPREFYAKLEQTRQKRENYLKMLRAFAVKHICLTYEKLFAHKERILADTGDFLHLTNPSFQFSDEKKGNPFRPIEIIENFEEVKDYLKKYPSYYEMLLQQDGNPSPAMHEDAEKVPTPVDRKILRQLNT